MRWAAALQLVFIPLRGKLSLFQKLFLDADLYISAGVAFVGVDERADVLWTDPSTMSNICTGPTAVDGTGMSSAECRATQTRTSRVAITGTFGVGLRIYANEWMALNMEYRAIPFSWNTSGTDEGGQSANGHDGFSDGQVNSDDWIFHFNHMFTVGWTFYLPTNARISQ
jgi:outer membrane beta-barrel protein